MKLKGSTLIESIVAMVIISFVIGMASVSYMNILRSQSNVRKLKMNDVMEQIANEAKTQHKYIDEEIVFDDFKVIKHFIKYDEAKGLSVMELQAVDGSGKILEVKKQLVINFTNE